jgi:ABC-type branched-subunit amino acid transport system substrate-binding protein
MKKSTVGFIVVILAIAIAFGLYRAGVFSNENDPIKVVVTVLGDIENHPGTERAIKSVQLYLDKANAEGGVNGRPLELVVKVDGGDPAKAGDVARDIAENSQALVVLGNTYSDAATVAGQVYKEYHVPVITSGATAPGVTEGNDWFFRVINDNTAQGIYIAEYSTAILGHKTAAVVFEDNSYGESLSDAFVESFESLGGEILDVAPIAYKSETLAEDANTIISSYSEKPDVVFLATYKTSGVAMVQSIRAHSTSMDILAGDDVGDSFFATKYIEENGGDPDDLENMYAASPLIFDVASEDAQRFRDKYIVEYGQIPTWFSATTYDSALVAVEAMRAAGISGAPEDVQEDREKIQKYLDSRNSPENSIEGITGNIHFTHNNNFLQPMAMGIFQNGQFISAPTQLAAISGHESLSEISDKINKGTIIRVGKKYFYKTQIIYVGIDINEFNNVDIDGERTYLADFYLWFRYNGDLDFNNLIFDNSVEPVSLDEPLVQKKIGDTSYCLYRIRDTFTDAFNLSEYPFDEQYLSLRLRHSTLERKNLIFVVDTLGLGDVTTRQTILDSLTQARAFDSVNDWEPTNGFFFADTVHEYTTRGNPEQFGKKSDIQHSRFNAAIEIKRDVIRFTAKTMLPVLCIIVLAYLGLFLPGREFETITSIMTGTVLSVVFFHVDLSGRLNVGYTVALDYAFYAIYALLATELFISIIAWHKSAKDENDKSIKILFWAMRLLYPIVLIGGAIAIIYFYDVSIAGIS